MKVLLVLLVVLVAVATHTTPSLPIRDMRIYKKCQDLKRLLFRGECSRMDGFDPCEEVPRKMRRTKCGKALRKLEKLAKGRWYCDSATELCEATEAPSPYTDYYSYKE